MGLRQRNLLAKTSPPKLLLLRVPAFLAGLPAIISCTPKHWSQPP